MMNSPTAIKILGAIMVFGTLYFPGIPAVAQDKDKPAGDAASVTATVVEIEIRGLNKGLEQNVRAVLSLSDIDEQLSAARIRRLHDASEAEIRMALRPYGYYDPVISSELKKSGDKWVAAYDIDRGPATGLRNIDVQIRGAGQQNAELQKMLQANALEVGKRLRHSHYEKLKTALQEAAFREGYLDAVYERKELIVRPDIQAADVVLHLQTGPQYHFGAVSIEQDILEPDLIERYVEIEQGEPFDPDKLLDLQFDLSDTDYFRTVEVKTDRDQATPENNRHVPIRVETQPKPRTRYTAGVGFGTDTGPRLALGMERRRVNRKGHRFRTDLRLSAIKNSLSAQYLIPIEDVTRDTLALKANIQQEEDIGDGESELIQVGVSRNTGWLGWRRSVYLNYELEQSFFTSEQRTGLLIPGVTLSRVHQGETADQGFYIRRGWRLTLDLHGAHESVASDVSFIQGSIGARGILPLGQKIRFLTRFDVGATEVDATAELPASQRFFAGGDHSVRGYGFRDLGPRDGNDRVVGGRYLATASAELDFRFLDKWLAAVFIDVGDADDDTTFNVNRGVGVGVRWISPVGMIRLDLAHPLDDPDTNVRVHFSIGTDL